LIFVVAGIKILIVDFGMSAHNAQFFVDMFSEAFGWMPQRAVKKGMGDIVFFGSNEWIVLRRQNDRALLLAKDITDIGLPYHDKLEAATWENCSLRAWLNTVFLNRFSEKERDRIDRVWQTNERNQWYGGVNGQKTRDGIFLLSIAEVVELFGDSGHLQSRPGNQWIDDRTDESAGSVITDESAGSVITDESAGFVIVQKGESCAIDDQYNERRRAKYRDSYTWWWLRSSGKSNAYAAYVNVGGVISVNGDLIFDDGGNNRMGVKPGVRPALWLMN